MLEVAARRAFAGFTLDAGFVAPAGVTALFGPSGSGKSSVLAAVAGLMRPDAGRVVVAGRMLLDTAAGVDVAAERRRCGMVFQDARLFPHMTVATNLRYGARRAPEGEAGPGFDEVVALLGLGGLLRRRPRGLSGGERQRVGLGRAMLSRPRVLLMDEPLAALDAARKAEILPFLERLHRASGVPMLYVTHALDEVDRLADTLVLMEAGRVVAAGPVAALATRTDLPGLAGRRDAGALLPCTVAGHDDARGLTRLAFDGGVLLVPRRTEAEGARLRLRMRARDVAVATSEPVGISSHNVLPAVVRAVAEAGGTEVLVTLAVGPTPILARLTRNAVTTLGISPGRALYALIKSTAFDHG